MKRNATNASHQQTNKQTAKTATHCISSSIQELAFCPQNNLLLLLLLFASFKLWVGFFGSAENSVLTYHAHTSWRQALPQYARPVVAYFDSGLSNTTTIADSLYLLFYTACVCVFRPQEFGIRAITSSTTPHRHTTTNGCFANFFLLLFSGPIIHTLSAACLCLRLCSTLSN